MKEKCIYCVDGEVRNCLIKIVGDIVGRIRCLYALTDRPFKECKHYSAHYYKSTNANGMP